MKDDAIVAALPLDLDDGVIDALVATDAPIKRRSRKPPAAASVEAHEPPAAAGPATDDAPRLERRVLATRLGRIEA